MCETRPSHAPLADCYHMALGVGSSTYSWMMSFRSSEVKHGRPRLTPLGDGRLGWMRISGRIYQWPRCAKGWLLYKITLSVAHFSGRARQLYARWAIVSLQIFPVEANKMHGPVCIIQVPEHISPNSRLCRWLDPVPLEPCRLGYVCSHAKMG